MISLANGCVCCTIRDDLIESVVATIERPEQPDYIVLEASGIADPAGIMVTFERLKLWQIACADMLIVNKVDLVDGAQLERISAWLDERFHRVRVGRTSQWRSGCPQARPRTDPPRPSRRSAGHHRFGRAHELRPA